MEISKVSACEHDKLSLNENDDGDGDLFKNTESESLDSSIDFLHDFTLFVIDMHQNRSISLVSTLF